jgi:hypothetical protein
MWGCAATPFRSTVLWFDQVPLLVNKSGCYWLDIWTVQVSPTKCPFTKRLESTLFVVTLQIRK